MRLSHFQGKAGNRGLPVMSGVSLFSVMSGRDQRNLPFRNPNICGQTVAIPLRGLTGMQEFRNQRVIEL